MENSRPQQEILENNYDHVIYRISDGRVIYFLNIDIRSVTFEAALETILSDDNIEEVMYNGPHQPIRIFHHRYGMCDTNVTFSEEDAMRVISDVARYNQKTIGRQNPLLDGALVDGSRVNIVIPPASLDISITIRKFKHTSITVLDLIRDNVFSPEITAFLWTCISRTGNPANILFVGGTATGKTTVLNAFAMLIGSKERVVVIEDTPELQLRQPNIVRMISNKEKGIDMDDLLKNALRMRPDRILVGEVRGSEALTLFNAMNTGHDGSLGTLHANSSKECVSRITNPPMGVPIMMLAALNLIVVMKKLPEGGRFVEEISEIAGVDSLNVRLNKVYEWNPANNQCVPTGIPSRMKAKMASQAGISVKDIDNSIAARKALLEILIEQNAGINELIEAINQPLPPLSELNAELSSIRAEKKK